MENVFLNHGMCGLLKRAVRISADNKAYGDERAFFTWNETDEISSSISSAIIGLFDDRKKPVAVYMKKSPECIMAFWGVLKSGNFYCPIDSQMPEKRVETILNILKPECIITDKEHEAKVRGIYNDAPLLIYENIRNNEYDSEIIELIYKRVSEEDPLYVLFTSGSTGVPKGVLVSHKVMLNYFCWLDENFEYNSSDVFGNQAPLYFDVSAHDVYGAAYFGATMEIIPEQLFSFPIKLIQYMNEKKISTFLWVPSAMSIVARLKTFKAEKPAHLRHVMFAGEVLQRKFLDYWIEHIPNAVYANLYGPTETFVCTAHIYDGTEDKDEPLPIGIPINNSEAIILDEDNKQISNGETGELCMRGSCLSLGYYNNKEKTDASYVQNPLNEVYPDRIYKTGDLVRIDEYGNIIYVSRKDYQIKHMGYRIELGEIENAAGLIENMGECACIYDDKRKMIVFFYDGKRRDEDELGKLLSERVPDYMIPGRYINMPVLPHNDNGKIDRKRLKEEM